jgi:hypothetical protein
MSYRFPQKLPAKVQIILLKRVRHPLNNVKKKKKVSDEKISTMNFGLLT